VINGIPYTFEEVLVKGGVSVETVVITVSSRSGSQHSKAKSEFLRGNSYRRPEK
jgi:hypothetical protein